MSYFQEEEVYNIELTEYGKKKISEGEFEPEYYSFHDGDVIYDSEYAGFTEDQNTIKDRILNTARLKNTTAFSGSDKKDRKDEKNLLSYNERMMRKSMGTARNKQKENPYISVNFFGEVEFESFDKFESSNKERIPQINLKDIEYDTVV